MGISVSTDREDILAVSGGEGAQVGAQQPGQDHEAGMELDQRALVPRHLGEVPQVH